MSAKLDKEAVVNVVCNDKRFAFGFKPEWLSWRIEGVPEGARVKVKFRSREAGRAYVKLGGVTRKFWLEMLEDGVFGLLESGEVNARVEA